MSYDELFLEDTDLLNAINFELEFVNEAFNKKDIVTIINSLPGILSLKPASKKQVLDAETQLGLKFAEEYKEYLYAFGAISADGIELTGISKAKHRDVITLTKKEWDLNEKVPHTMYVVENTGIDGIIIWQDKKGFIYTSKPFTEPKKINNSLTEYILNISNNTNT